MQIFELWAKLGMKTDEYDSKIASAKEKATSLGGSFSKFGSIASKAFLAAQGAASAFIGTSIRTGMNFDSAMSQVGATMGKSIDEIQDLRKFAQEMGRTTAFSASEAASAMNILAMAGYDAKQNMATLPTVLSLAAAGGLSLADSADYVTGIMAGFGLEMDQAGSIANKLAMISKSAKGDVASFGEGLSTVAGMAKTTGQNMDDMTVALGILGNNNYSASEAGNALSRTLRNLYQPSDSAAKMLKQIGVSAYDAQGNAKPLQQVLQELNGRLSGLDAQAKNQVLSKIFDAATLKSVPALMNNAGAAWDDLSAKIKAADAEGTAASMQETQLNNLQGAMTLFRSAVEGAQIAISDSLTPSLIEFVNLGSKAVSDLTGAFTEGGVDGFFEKFTEVFGNLSDVVLGKIPEFASIGVKLLSSIVIGLGSAVPSFVKAVQDSFALLFNGAIRGIPKIIRGARDITLSASAFIKSFGDGLVNGIPDALAQIMPFINALVERMSENAIMFANAGIDMVANLIRGLGNGLPTLLNYIPQMITNVAEVFMNTIPQLVGLGALFIETIANGVTEAIPAFFQRILPMLLDFVSNLRTNARTLQRSGADLMMNIVQGFVDSIPLFIEYIPQILQEIGGMIMDKIPFMVESGVAMMQALGQGFVEGIPVLLETGLSMLADFTGSLHEASIPLIDAGMDMLVNLIQGIMNGLPALIENVPIIVMNIANVINDNMPRILAAGVQILWTLISGLISAIPSLLANIGTIMLAAIDVIQAINWLGVGTKILDTIVNGIVNIGYNLPTTLKNFAQQAWDWVRNIDWLSLGKNIISGIVSGIRNLGGSIGSALKSAASGAFNAVKGFFKIGSPSKLMADEIGRWLPEGIAVGITGNADSLYDAMNDLSVGTMDAYNPKFKDYNVGGDQITPIVDEIKALRGTFQNMGVYLDSGALVGGIAGGMDQQLGSFAVYKGRGN